MAMPDNSRPVYMISIAAELAGMHPQTLRIYEQRGLIEPDRSPKGTRRYSQADVERLRRIQDLAADGMNLEGIRRVMELELEVERLQAENSELRTRVATVEADAGRREPRRDLVPLHQTVAIFGGSRLGERR